MKLRLITLLAFGLVISLIALGKDSFFLETIHHIDNGKYYAIRFGLIAAFAACILKIKSWNYTSPTAIAKPLNTIIVGPDPLLSLRALACAMVLLGHFFMVVFPLRNFDKVYLSKNPVWLLTSSPWAGVWVFFTLSGYLMGKGFFTGRYNFSGTALLSFYRNRLYRILPVAVFVMLLTIVLSHPELVDRHNIWLLLGFLSFDYQEIPIGAFWSVNTEMQFYLLVPFFCFALFSSIQNGPFLKWLAFIGVASVVTFLPVARANVFNAHPDMGYYFITAYKPLWWNMDIFAIGIFSNIILNICRKYITTRVSCIITGCIIIAAMYVVASFVSAKVIQGSLNYQHFFVIFLPSLIAVFTGAGIIAFELARERGELKDHSVIRMIIARTQFFGTLTYCIYVWHAPVLLSFKKIMPAENWRQSADSSIVSFIFIIGISVITYYAVEKPFDKKRHLPLYDCKTSNPS